MEAEEGCQRTSGLETQIAEPLTARIVVLTGRSVFE